MTIVLGLPVLYGALAGLALALILKLLVGILGDFMSFGGIGSVGSKLSLDSYLSGLGKPAAILSTLGAIIGLAWM